MDHIGIPEKPEGNSINFHNARVLGFERITRIHSACLSIVQCPSAIKLIVLEFLYELEVV